MDLALDNLQWLICHRIKPANQMIYLFCFVFCFVLLIFRYCFT